MIYFPVFIIHIHTFYLYFFCFFFNDTATTEIYTLSLHDALPISALEAELDQTGCHASRARHQLGRPQRSEEHTSELQSQFHIVCRLLLEKKKQVVWRLRRQKERDQLKNE